MDMRTVAESDNVTRYEERSEADTETKNEKFVRLANFRLSEAVKRIRMLKPLASVNYEYTKEQAEFLIVSLDNEVAKLEKELLPEEASNPIPQLGSGESE